MSSTKFSNRSVTRTMAVELMTWMDTVDNVESTGPSRDNLKVHTRGDAWKSEVT